MTYLSILVPLTSSPFQYSLIMLFFLSIVFLFLREEKIFGMESHVIQDWLKLTPNVLHKSM